MDTVKLTDLEKKLVDYIANSDHSTDGHGLGGWIDARDFDMNIFRGVMSSLIKKKVAFFEEDKSMVNQYKYTNIWASISPEFQEEIQNTSDLSNYTEEEKSLISDTNYRLINLN